MGHFAVVVLSAIVILAINLMKSIQQQWQQRVLFCSKQWPKIKLNQIKRDVKKMRDLINNYIMPELKYNNIIYDISHTFHSINGYLKKKTRIVF